MLQNLNFVLLSMLLGQEEKYIQEKWEDGPGDKNSWQF